MSSRTGLACALALAVLWPARAGRADVVAAGPPPAEEPAETGGVAGGDEAERPDEGGVGESETPATPTRASKRRSKKRKGVSGHLVTEDRLRKRLPPPPSGNLYLYRTVE